MHSHTESSNTNNFSVHYYRVKSLGGGKWLTPTFAFFLFTYLQKGELGTVGLTVALWLSI